MKKLLLTTLALTAAVSSFAFDFGGAAGNLSKFQKSGEEDFKINQKNFASLWTRIPFGETSAYFAAQGRFQFEYDGLSETTVNAADLDYAQLYFSAGNFEFKFGRFARSDLSGIVYNQAGDGAEISYAVPSFNASAWAAYTGLLNSQLTTINDPDYSADSEKIYDPCAKYITGGAKVSFPSLFAEQTLSLEAVLAKRLEGVKYDRLFAELALEGPLSFINGLFYDLTGVIGISSYDDGDPLLSYLAKTDISFYPGVKDAKIALSAVYASGTPDSADADTTAFLAFTSTTAVNSVQQDEFSSIFLPGISASIKPLKSLLVSAGSDLVFSTNENKVKYAGFQYNAGADWQIVSDVYAGAALTQYFDKDNSNNSRTAVSLKAVILF